MVWYPQSSNRPVNIALIKPVFMFRQCKFFERKYGQDDVSYKVISRYFLVRSNFGNICHHSELYHLHQGKAQFGPL